MKLRSADELTRNQTNLTTNAEAQLPEELTRIRSPVVSATAMTLRGSIRNLQTLWEVQHADKTNGDSTFARLSSPQLDSFRVVYYNDCDQ